MNLFIPKLLSLYLHNLLSIIVHLTSQRMLATSRDTNAKNIVRFYVRIAEQTFIVLSKYTRAFDTVSVLLMKDGRLLKLPGSYQLFLTRCHCFFFYKKSLEMQCSDFQTHFPNLRDAFLMTAFIML